MIMRKTSHMDGIEIGDFNVNIIRYAAGYAILADSEEHLQKPHGYNSGGKKKILPRTKERLSV